ncbi:hypothetical protein K402DRAFT_224915 [Aulographum hederae CBS 113979]|uniref:Rrn9 domain-containing protein n=1 Tax=Aulographum hederae CBS 113979 TaxID=1176131 RepID=A0A6G1HB08_9PEZI|nr:hypothetical protein K402DRAFT_224915 [Aulographum hederae CBS 113979]
MSLFGGEPDIIREERRNQSRKSGRNTEDEDDHDQIGYDIPDAQRTVKSSPAPSENEQAALEDEDLSGLDDDDDADLSPGESEDDPEDDVEDEDEEERRERYIASLSNPKRMKQWLKATESDRAIAEGEHRSQAENLSVHLYNAHALKRRMYPKVDGPTSDTALKKGKWMTMQDQSEAWIPGDPWTAWPLPPDDVPPVDARFKDIDDDGLGMFTFKWNEQESHSQMLEEHLLSNLMRQTKEALRHNHSQELPINPRKRRRTESVSAGSTSDQSSTSATIVKPDTKEDSRPGDRNIKGSDHDANSGDDDPNEEEEESNSEDDNSDQDEEEEPQTPEMLLDDDIAHRILQPSMQSLMGNLNNLLTGLHRSRKGIYSRSKYYRPLRIRHGGKDRPKIELQDWSSVLGIAGMTGWDPAAVERASKRCSALFRESMVFQTVDMEGKMHESPEEATNVDTQVPQQLDMSFDRESLLCPHTDCPRSHTPAESLQALLTHIRTKHGWDPNEEAGPLAHPDVCGGVHVDGFLQPLAKRRSWREDKSRMAEKMAERTAERTAEWTSARTTGLKCNRTRHERAFPASGHTGSRS